MNAYEQCALVEVAPGALMLDLGSGVLLELNQSGSFIWKRRLAGQPEPEIARELVERYSVDHDTARRHVQEALKISLENVPQPPPTQFNYERNDNSYVFRFRGDVVFVVDEHGEQLAMPEPRNRESLPYLLQAVAPKLLALRGQTVLHASAVRLGDAAVAFSGISGAGKTTTARAFVAAGAGFVCEDKLAIKVSDSGTYVAVDGEKLVADWVSSAAGDLVRTGTAACSRLDFAATGTMVPLAEIGFLDVRRRSPGSHAGRSLSPLEVAGAVFRNAFYGSDVSKDWIRHLHVAAMIGRTVRGYELTLPDGLDRLAQTAAELTRVSSIRS